MLSGTARAFRTGQYESHIINQTVWAYVLEGNPPWYNMTKLFGPVLQTLHTLLVHLALQYTVGNNYCLKDRASKTVGAR